MNPEAAQAAILAWVAMVVVTAPIIAGGIIILLQQMARIIAMQQEVRNQGKILEVHEKVLNGAAKEVERHG